MPTSQELTQLEHTLVQQVDRFLERGTDNSCLGSDAVDDDPMTFHHLSDPSADGALVQS